MDELSSGSEESSTTKEIQRVRERLLLIRQSMEGDLDGNGSSSDTSSSSSSTTLSSSSSSSDDVKHSGSTGVVLNETTNTTGQGAEPVDFWEAAPNNLPHKSNPIKSTIPRVEAGDAAQNALDGGYGRNKSHHASSNPLAVKMVALTQVGASANTSKTVSSTSVPTKDSRHQLTQAASPGSNENGEGSGYNFTMNEGTTTIGKRTLEVSSESWKLPTSIATRSGESRSELEEGIVNTTCASHDDDGHAGESRPELEKDTTTQTCASKENNFADEHASKRSPEQFALQQSDGVSASRSHAECEHERSRDESDKSSDDSSSTSSSSSDSSSSSSSESTASRGGSRLSVPASFDDALAGRTNCDTTPKNVTQSMIPRSTAPHNSASSVLFYNPYKKPYNKGTPLPDAKGMGCGTPCPQGSNPGAFKTLSMQTRQPSPDAAQDTGDLFPFFADDCESSPMVESPDADRETTTSHFFLADTRAEPPPADSRVVETSAKQFMLDNHSTGKQSSSDRPVRHDTLSQLDNVLHEADAASQYTASSNVPPRIRPFFPSHDYGLEVEVFPEVDPANHALPTHYNKKPPVIHCFSFRNRPPQARQKIPIPELFTWPANLMWKSKFQTFNAFQSEMANHLCHSDDNIVVSAPTGAGKTTVFDMAIARFVTTDYNSTRHNQNSNVPNLSKHRKIVYIAPSKALCEERYEDWSRRFAEMNMGITVAMITGDGEAGQSFHDFASAHFILTTPEKFDGMSRRWTESFFLFASVKLFLLDEVHILGDKCRGCCLESIVARVKTIQRVARNIQASSEDIHTSSYADTTQHAISSCMRIVAVSATLPNIGDVAQFLDANEAYSFDESYRPVPLATHVVDCGNSGKNQFMFWNALDKRVSEQIRKYSDGKQTLIFCHTKKETEKLAQLLGGPSTNPGNPPTLQDWISSGVGYHHAGLQQSERKFVEEAFEEGKLRCLCATSSLAVGVNLPARLVIVKGTKTYRGGGSGYQDVDTAQLLQMVGRAGRPGLDTRGTAVILTDAQSKAHVEYLLQGFDPAESHLNSRLVEILNTEVSQGVITSVGDAVKWMSSTFLYVRLQKDPRAYGSHENSTHSTEAYLEKIVRQSLEQLREIGAVPADYGKSVYPLSASHIMSQRLTSFAAMKAIAMLPFDATECQILHCLSQMEAIQYPLRRHEKKLLNECHQEVRFKLAIPSKKFKIQSMSEKAFVLLQACIGQQYFEDFTLRQEMSSMTEQCSAVLTAAQEFSTRGSKNGYVALQCYKLKRSLYASLWGEASGVLNQLAGLGQKYTRILSMNGISTFSDVMSSSDEAIAKACGQGVSFGNDLRAKVSQLLSDKLHISAVMEYAEGTDSPVGVACSVSSDKDTPNRASQSRSSGLKYTLEDITGSGSYRFKCPSSFGKIFIHLVASMIGLDDAVELKGNGEIQPSSYTESSVGISQPALEKATDSQKKPNHSQSDIRQAFKSSVKTVADPRLARARGGKPDHGGFKARQVRDPAPASAMTARSDLRRNDTVRSRASVTPSPKVTNYTKDATRASNTPIVPKATSDNCQELATPFRTDNHVPLSDYHPVRTSKETPEIPRLLLAESSTGPLGGASNAQHAGSRSIQDRPLRSVENIAFSSAEKRGLVANTSWNQQRRKQQKQQGRAFNQKKDNPFASYQHDPNDAESHLESLCFDTGNGQKIIPPAELDALLRSSTRNPRPPFAMSGRSNQKGRSNQRRRRAVSPHGHATEQDLLRLKADEQDAYALPAKPRFIHPSTRQLQHHPNHGDFFHHETPSHNDYRGGPGTQRDLYSLGSQYPQACYLDSQASPIAWVPRVPVVSRRQHNPAFQGFTQRGAEPSPQSMSPSFFIDTTDSVVAYDEDYQSPSNRMTWESEDMIHANEYSCFDLYNGSDQSGVLPRPTQDIHRDAHPDGIHANERSQEESDFKEAFF